MEGKGIDPPSGASIISTLASADWTKNWLTEKWNFSAVFWMDSSSPQGIRMENVTLSSGCLTFTAFFLFGLFMFVFGWFVSQRIPSWIPRCFWNHSSWSRSNATQCHATVFFPLKEFHQALF